MASTGSRLIPQECRSDGSSRAGISSCKRCGGPETARHGNTRGGKQRLRCRTCGATFLDNSSLPRMRFSTQVIAAALESFYGGATLREIAATLAPHGEAAPNYANIHRWIVLYSTAAVDALAEPIPGVGATWLAVESRIESRVSIVADTLWRTTGLLPSFL